MEALFNNVSSFYANTLEIKDIVFQYQVKEPEDVVNQMLNTPVLLANDPELGETKLVEARGISREILSTITRQLRNNVAPGDFVIEVTLVDKVGKRQLRSINTMRPDASAFSGFLFGASRLAIESVSRAKRANTECEERVLARYLWGSPAEMIWACAAATCNNGTCEACRLTEILAFPGFFTKLETLPKEPVDGRIIGNCCEAHVAWTWASGFKRIKTKIGGPDGNVEFDIEGTIGQSSNGFFTVRECCTAVSDSERGQGR